MTDAGQCGVRVLGTPHSHKLRGATNEVAKVTNGLPTVRSDVQLGRTTGSPTGCEPYGDGASIVVVGVTTDQGGRESRLQGEGRQAFSTTKMGRYAGWGGTRDAERRNRPRGHRNGGNSEVGKSMLESRMMRKHPVRFGEGPKEKGCSHSTSPLAYSTTEHLQQNLEQAMVGPLSPRYLCRGDAPAARCTRGIRALALLVVSAAPH